MFLPSSSSDSYRRSSSASLLLTHQLVRIHRIKFRPSWIGFIHQGAAWVKSSLATTLESHYCPLQTKKKPRKHPDLIYRPLVNHFKLTSLTYDLWFIKKISIYFTAVYIKKFLLCFFSTAERPWLDLCLSAYTVEENGRTQACYQVMNTEAKGNFCTPQWDQISFGWKMLGRKCSDVLLDWTHFS